MSYCYFLPIANHIKNYRRRLDGVFYCSFELGKVHINNFIDMLSGIKPSSAALVHAKALLNIVD